MADIYGMKSKQQAFAATSKPVLRDTAEDKLLKPRPKKMIRLIKTLDVLTAGDEQLYEYLKAQQAEAAKRVEQAKEDMEMAETPEEAAEFAPDPMDELIAQDVPAVNTFDFEAFKSSLLQTCQNQLEEMMQSCLSSSVPYGVYAGCSIKGCRIHSISADGMIREHISAKVSASNRDLCEIEKILLHDDVSHVEMYGDRLSIVYTDGHCDVRKNRQ